MSANTPWTKTEEMVEDPERRERWCWDRYVKEWPQIDVDDTTKALMFLALQINAEEGPVANAAYELGRIADALEKLVKK